MATANQSCFKIPGVDPQRTSSVSASLPVAQAEKILNKNASVRFTTCANRKIHVDFDPSGNPKGRNGMKFAQRVGTVVSRNAPVIKAVVNAAAAGDEAVFEAPVVFVVPAVQAKIGGVTGFEAVEPVASVAASVVQTMPALQVSPTAHSQQTIITQFEDRWNSKEITGQFLTLLSPFFML
ncbi:hypothetical protein LWI29_037452 [Acer saccharum]|uniref:Uncharacterized protein n=1 Tax=Acer saccharum TaxID=4024 RepID=A0AA39U153_ACESA|nr:hypothetical protein LWI29_037452 [Acer saccharum]